MSTCSIGPYSSGITQAVAPLINKYEKVTIDPGGLAAAISTSPATSGTSRGFRLRTGYLEGVLPLAKSKG